MPLLKPKKYEEKASFMSRFMNNAKMIVEYPNIKQRYVVGLDLWVKHFSQIFLAYCCFFINFVLKTKDYENNITYNYYFIIYQLRRQL